LKHNGMFNFKIGGRNCNSSSSVDERHYLLQDARCRLHLIWNMMPSWLVYRYQCFREACCLYRAVTLFLNITPKLWWTHIAVQHKGNSYSVGLQKIHHHVNKSHCWEFWVATSMGYNFFKKCSISPNFLL
jgi:hypothetical protein